MRTRSIRRALTTAAVGTALLLFAGSAEAAVTFSVTPDDETTPVAHSGDAADDPAVWYDATDPSRSRVIGTDKDGYLEVYDLSGNRVQRIADSSNNVDVRDNLVIGADDEYGGHLRIYRMDPATRTLRYLDSVATDVTAHGICMYDAGNGVYYAYPNSLSGRTEQWEITVSGDTVDATSVRLFDVGGAVEGCDGDERTGKLYIGEENVGVWRYGALPSDGTSRTRIDHTGSTGHLVADVEGIATAGDHLFVSSQGESRFAVYDRYSNAYLGKFAVSSGSLADGCSDTDGIEATSSGLGSLYPNGIFICQDGSNGSPNSGNQNFKFVRLEKITNNL